MHDMKCPARKAITDVCYHMATIANGDIKPETVFPAYTSTNPNIKPFRVAIITEALEYLNGTLIELQVGGDEALESYNCKCHDGNVS